MGPAEGVRPMRSKVSVLRACIKIHVVSQLLLQRALPMIYSQQRVRHSSQTA